MTANAHLLYKVPWMLAGGNQARMHMPGISGLLVPRVSDRRGSDVKDTRSGQYCRGMPERMAMHDCACAA